MESEDGIHFIFSSLSYKRSKRIKEKGTSFVVVNVCVRLLLRCKRGTNTGQILFSSSVRLRMPEKRKILYTKKAGWIRVYNKALLHLWRKSFSSLFFPSSPSGYGGFVQTNGERYPELLAYDSIFLFPGSASSRESLKFWGICPCLARTQIRFSFILSVNEGQVSILFPLLYTHSKLFC